MFVPVAQYVNNINMMPFEDEMAYVWYYQEKEKKVEDTIHTVFLNSSGNLHFPKSTEEIIMESVYLDRYISGMSKFQSLIPCIVPSLEGVSIAHLVKEFTRVMSVVASKNVVSHVEFDQQDECIFIYSSINGKKIFFNFFFESCNIEAQINVSSDAKYLSFDGTVSECLEKLYDEIGRGTDISRTLVA